MRHFGFSSWGWEPTTVESVRYLASQNVKAVELSALRYTQLGDLFHLISRDCGFALLLKQFDVVTLHAPSNTPQDKEFITSFLYEVDTPSHWQIVLHPDCIWDCSNWEYIQNRLCIENMDARKKSGQTVADLKKVFEQLPYANFCFDIGHARQVDPTMRLARELVDAFGYKIKEIHMSLVEHGSGGHSHLSDEAVFCFRHILPYVKDDIVVIAETPSDKLMIDANLSRAKKSFLPHERK